MEIPVHENENEQNLLPPADWAIEVQELQEELLHERDRNLRTLADFKNYRRRIERDGNKIAEESKRGMLLPMLDIVDDIEKALKSAHDAKQPFVKGVHIIHQKFLALLATHGVLPFESVGTSFDHNLHEAVAMVKHEHSEPGIVVDELRRGYLWNNELLRPAQVRVAG
ncbi:MAG: nucleotide exchange factor GrpE [Bacteroidota bacterium]|jgi:molecular chaperone GrpE